MLDTGIGNRKLKTVYKAITYLFALLLCFNPVLLMAAEIKVDQNAIAAQQATLNEAANGVPIVEITAPSQGGVSMNAFTDYNVDE
jgi:filamentous hemagglutinin